MSLFYVIFLNCLFSIINARPYTGNIVFIDNDKEMNFNSAPPSISIKYSNEEMECFSQEKVFFNGQCFDLWTSKPCKQGEWLILDNSTRGIYPKCSKMICPNDAVYWKPTKRCIPKNKQQVCTKTGTELDANLFGIGECQCKGVIVRTMYENGACYELYSKGPCKLGHVLTESEEDYKSLCTLDPCRFQKLNSSKNETLLYYPPADKCYPKETRGPCEEDYVLSIHAKTRQVSCLPGLALQHLVDVPEHCVGVNHKHNCADTIRVEEQSEQYILHLLSVKRRKKKT